MRSTVLMAAAELVAPSTTPYEIFPPWGLSMVFSGVWASDTDARHPIKPSLRAKETQNGLFLCTIVLLPLMDKNLL
jgi:hypothetical protein